MKISCTIAKNFNLKQKRSGVDGRSAFVFTSSSELMLSIFFTVALVIL